MRIKKRVTAVVKKQVAALLVQDRELSAPELKSKTEKALKGGVKNTDLLFALTAI